MTGSSAPPHLGCQRRYFQARGGYRMLSPLSDSFQRAVRKMIPGIGCESDGRTRRLRTARQLPWQHSGSHCLNLYISISKRVASFFSLVACKVLRKDSAFFGNFQLYMRGCSRKININAYPQKSPLDKGNVRTLDRLTACLRKI